MIKTEKLIPISNSPKKFLQFRPIKDLTISQILIILLREEGEKHEEDNRMCNLLN